MSSMQQSVETRTAPSAPGHAIGFVERQSECDALIQALTAAGFSEEQIAVLQGEAGISFLNQMLEGSLWGESAEEVLKQGTAELRTGHTAICVEVQDAEAAATVAAISMQHGGYSVYHFGGMLDTRLTA